MNIYSEIVLEHYKNPHNYGSISKANKKTVLFNPSCGDRIEMEAVFTKKKLEEIKFRGQGCAISIASASMLTYYVKNKANEDLQKLDKEFMIKMLGINLGPSRIKCALLPLEALHNLINSKS